MTIGFHTQHFRLGKFIFELVVIFKFEAGNHINIFIQDQLLKN